LDEKKSTGLFTNKYDTNLLDLNYITNQKYKNIFELRKLKNHYLMHIMPKKVKNYILINYEDLLYNFEKTMQIIKDKYNLLQKTETFVKVKKYKKCETYNFVKQREILFTLPIIKLIWKHLDIEQETSLGYKPFDNNKIFLNKYQPQPQPEPNLDNIPLSDG